jgi:hypothetical protein
VAALAQNGDGLRPDQAGAANDDDLHDLPSLADDLRLFAPLCIPSIFGMRALRRRKSRAGGSTAHQSERGAGLGGTRRANVRGFRVFIGSSHGIRHHAVQERSRRSGDQNRLIGGQGPSQRLDLTLIGYAFRRRRERCIRTVTASTERNVRSSQERPSSVTVKRTATGVRAGVRSRKCGDLVEKIRSGARVSHYFGQPASSGPSSSMPISWKATADIFQQYRPGAVQVGHGSTPSMICPGSYRNDFSRLDAPVTFFRTR